MRRWSGFAVAVAMGVVGVGAGVAQQAGEKAGNPVAATPAVETKLDQTLDTGFTREGDKISAVLQADATLNATKFPKGTKLTGTVVKSVKQDKQHPNAGLVLLFDTAVLKDGSKMPVRAAIVSLAPSHADEVEQVEAGSGQVTDAALRAMEVSGRMDDANQSMTANSTTSVNGVKTTSSIKNVVLFASPNGSVSGIVVARIGALQLDKWTRIRVVLEPR
jgi:hypothetical protein